MERPKLSHMMAAKRVLRYVKGTVDLGIMFPRTEKDVTVVEGFTDSDWSGDVGDRKSTSGYVFMMNGAPISWCTKKQNVVALSSCEAEYISAAQGACQALWLEKLMKELSIETGTVMKLNVDNKFAIDLAKHPVAHGKSKHIETKFHFLRDQVNKGNLELQHCKTTDQLADLLTKPLKTGRFMELRKLLSMESLGNLN